MSFFAGLLDDIDLDPMGFSLKNQMELMNDTNDAFKKRKANSVASGIGIDEINDINFSDDNDVPLKLTKKKKKKFYDSPPEFNSSKPVQEKKKKKSPPKKRSLKGFADEAEEDNTLPDFLDAGPGHNFTGVDFEIFNDSMFNRAPGHREVAHQPPPKTSTHIPLSAIQTRYNEYENDEIYSSCDELSDTDDEEELEEQSHTTSKRRKVEKEMNEAERILNVLKGKKMNDLIKPTNNEEPSHSESEHPSSPNSGIRGSSDSSPSLSSRKSEDKKDELVKGRLLKKAGPASLYDVIKKFNESSEPPGRRSKVCFGCVYSSKNDGAVDSSPFNAMVELIRQNYGSMSNRTLAKIVHKYYNRHIRLPMKARGQRIPRWRTLDVLEHIEAHTNDPVIWQGQTILKLKKISSAIKDMLFSVRQENGMQSIAFDKSLFRTMMEADKLIAAIYKMNPKEMLFYSENYRIDPGTYSRLISFHRDFVFDQPAIKG